MFSDALAQCLELLSAAYRAEITEELTRAWAIGVAGLAPFQMVRATKYLLEHHLEFMPTPADFMKAVVDSAPNNKSTADPNCKTCQGSGFKMVNRTDGNAGKWATVCDCRKGKS